MKTPQEWDDEWSRIFREVVDAVPIAEGALPLPERFISFIKEIQADARDSALDEAADACYEFRGTAFAANNCANAIRTLKGKQNV